MVLSDYGSDSEKDCTGDTTGDFTGTGDSVFFGSALPTEKFLKPPLTTKESSYAKLNPKSLDNTSTYCKLDSKNR